LPKIRENQTTPNSEKDTTSSRGSSLHRLLVAIN